MEKLFTKSVSKGNLIFNPYKNFARNIFCLIVFFISNISISQIYINEIMINPSGSNDGSNMPNTSEWVEFYNSSTSAVNIGCWFFTDGDFSVTFPAGATIPAGGYYTVASASGSGFTPSLNWATCGCTTNNPGNNSSLSGNQVGIFTNGSEQVLLYNNSGVLQDAVIWGGGQLTSALTLTIGTVGSCASKIVTIPSSTVSYENIGTSADGVAKERDYDASPTWQNSGTGTFGSTNGAVLPIELLDFSASLQGSIVNLIWHTAVEINNDYFTLERSTNGFDFETFYTIKGAGNSTSYNSYSAIDENHFSGIIYYRLKQVDFDKNFSYSQILAVESENMLDFNVFPNPSDNGSISISCKQSTNSYIEIINDIGQVLLKEDITKNLTEMDLGRFGKGIYMIKLNSNEKSASKKIIVN